VPLCFPRLLRSSFPCLAHSLPSAITRRRSPRSLSVQPPHLPLPASISLSHSRPLPSLFYFIFFDISSYSYLLPLSPHLLGVNSMLTIHPGLTWTPSPLPISASPSPPTALCQTEVFAISHIAASSESSG
jgi:hypothetical protein